MSLKEDRFHMSADKYLGFHHIGFYLEDCVTQLLEHKDENPKVNPAKFFSEYFHSVKDGNNTLFREYNYIHATSHNRASFVKLFWKCFHEIGKKGDLLSIQEYHSLLTLLCQDFPFDVVQKTARIILLDDALDCLISFSDFVYAFQIQFYYEEFIDKCSDIYQSLIQTQRSPRDPVVVPTSETNRHLNSHHMGDGVEAATFFRTIYPVCDRVNFSTPPVQALKDILFSIPRVSFYGFLMAVAKNELINYHIGRLPEKAKLLEGADMDIPTRGTSDRSDSVNNSHQTHKSRKPLSARKSPRKSKSRPTSAVKDTHLSSSGEVSASLKKTSHGHNSASHKRSNLGSARHSARRKAANSSDDTASDSSDSSTDSET